MITIENNAKLPFRIIGEFIDRYMTCDIQTTIYQGKEDYFGFVFNSKNYECKVIYRKTGCKYIFDEITSNNRK